MMVRSLMQRFCETSCCLAMPARLKFLTERPARLECFAETPRNFAGRPEDDGRVFRSPERCPTEGRDVLQRAVLGAVATLDAPLPDAGVKAGAQCAARRDLSLRRRRLGSRAAGRRAGYPAVARR